jgi:hypothetical protein
LKPAGVMRPNAQLGQIYEFSAPLGDLATGRHPGLLVDGYSRMYPGSYRWRRSAGDSPPQTRVEPVASAEALKTPQHPAWLEMKFEIVVP